MTSQTPFRIDLLPGESGRGYLLRAAEILEYSNPLLIREQAGIGKRGIEDGESLVKLAKYLRLDSKTIQGNFYVSLGAKRLSQVAPFLNEHIPRIYLNHSKPRVCPVCLQNEGVSKALWDLCFITACSKHECSLIDTCPRCNKPLAWLRHRLNFCSCGADLRLIPPTKATRAQIAIYNLLENCLSHTSQKSTHLDEYQYSTHLIEGGFNNALRAIDHLGFQFHRFINDFSAIPARCASVKESTTLVIMAHEVLSHWPSNLHKAIRKISKNAEEDRGDGGVYKRVITDFCRYRHSKLSSTGLKFIGEAFLEFMNESMFAPLRLREIISSEPPKRVHNWITPAEVAKLTGNVCSASIIRIVESGLMNGKILEIDGSRRRSIWIDRHAIDGWVRDGNNWISSIEAEKRLGVNKTLLRKMHARGLLQSRRGGIAGMMDTRNYLSKDIDAIHTAFMSSGYPLVNSCLQENEVTLRKLIHSGNSLAKVVERVMDGSIKPIGYEAPGSSILDSLFNKSDVHDLRYAGDNVDYSALMNKREAAKFLGVPDALVSALLRDGLLVTQLQSGKRGACFITKKDVLEFKEIHVFVSHLAAKMKTGSVQLRRLLDSMGIQGCEIRHQRNCATAIYRVEQLRGVEIQLKDGRYELGQVIEGLG